MNFNSMNLMMNNNMMNMNPMMMNMNPMMMNTNPTMMNMNPMMMNMNPAMMNMNQMMMNNMMGVNNMQNMNIGDYQGWNLIFQEKQGNKATVITISPDKTVHEAISLYKIKENINNKEMIKFIFNGKQLIPSLKLTYKDGKSMLNFECENNHKGDISLEEYIQIFNKYDLTKQNCEECNKNQKESKADYLYCNSCNKFLCLLCLNKHKKNEDNHKLFSLNSYDALCKTHSNSFDFYCVKCKKNICAYCKVKHKFHDLIDLSEFDFNDEDKNKLDEEIKNMELKIINLDKIKQEIINKIDNLKKSSELEMKFIKILLSAYEYEQNQNNLNYNVIQNLKNFEKIFKSNKIDIYDKIYEESKRYISFFDKFQNYQSNSFTNNFKTLQNHTNSIYYLSKLCDGRLVS